ncbi:unnamed protein product [Arabis nemorensis]|uniref:Aminotransferase-like plant mobile domain-containing protein n=1 Tax=Arabis nemorensis TaxID=586526 RepID=A0A565BFZ6_9BRAS|nr:unnamed protein product [Arabis nemorensis]
MDSITENQKDHCLIKTHFLKPLVTSIDGPVSELPHRRQKRFSVSSSDLEVLCSKITSTGFRLPSRDFTSWAKKMEALHEPTWRKAGIFEAIKASTYNAWRRSISGNVLPIAVRLARGEKVALAPAVLATLYRDLSRIHGLARCKSNKKVKLESLLKLVQVWIWERFRNISPEAREIQMGEPRIARWCIRGKRCEKNERLSFDDFDWRPYAKTIRNWSPPKFYVEEGKWMTVDESLDDEFVSFARCLRVSKLVGIGFVEDYYPNRVAMQFGLSQDLPGLVTHHSDNTEKEAWDDYDKSLDGLKLYIPSRLASTSVTARYQDWWLKSVSEFQSSEEGFQVNLERCRKRRKAKNVRSKKKKGKIGDCGGSTSREVTLSELFQKELAQRTREHLRNKRFKRAREDGFNGKLERCRKRRKANNVRSDLKKDKIGDCGGSTSREVPLSELFQKELAKSRSEHLRSKRACEDDDDDSSMDCYDDNITIAEIIKSRKKTGGDAFESLGKRSRHEEDNNDSGLVQKPASEDENVVPQEIEPRIEVNDEEETGNEAEKITVVIPSDGNNSSEPPTGSNGLTIEIFVSPQEKFGCEDETVATQEIEQRREEKEEETGIETEKIVVVIPSDENNSSDPSHLAFNGGLVETAVSPQETRQNCDVNGSDTEEKTMIDDGTKKEECLIHINGENQREKLRSEVKKEEEIDERLKQRKLAIEEIALKLEARIMKMEKSLTKIRDWKTKRNQTSSKVST